MEIRSVNDELYKRVGTASITTEPSYLIIPVGNRIPESLTILNTTSRTYHPDDPEYPGPGTVNQAPGIKPEKAPPLITTQYTGNKDTSATQILTIRKLGTLRGHNLMVLDYVPVIRNRDSQTVSVHNSIEAEIVFRNDPGMRDPAHSPSFTRILNRLSGNSAPVQNHGSWFNSGHLLIITPDQFRSVLSPFICWKIQKGYDVSVATTGETGTGAADIKAFIENAVYYWNNPPDYVLFAGNSGFIPAFDGERYPDSTAQVEYSTDLYYATLDGPGDFIPDILVGRFPAKTEEELAFIIDKTIGYELPEIQDMTWLSHSTFIATGDPVFSSLVKNTHRYALNTYLSPANLPADSIWISDGGSTSDLEAAINAGTGLICYSGHGTPYQWIDEYPLFNFWSENIDGLDNPGKNPVILSFGCDAGFYGGTLPSLGEYWLAASTEGASLFWGASHLTFWYEDDYLERRVWDNLFSGYFRTFSEIALEARIRVWARGYPTGEYYMEIYNCLGDPTLETGIGVPQTMSVAYQDTLPDNSSAIDIVTDLPPTASGWASVTVDTSIIAQTCLLNGCATLHFSKDITGADSATITVISPGYRPFSGGLVFENQGAISFSPTELTVGTSSEICIQVTDPDSLPMEGKTVKVNGFGISLPLSGLTDSLGTVCFDVQPQFGESLAVCCYSPEGNLIISGILPVTGAGTFNSVTFSASTPDTDTDGYLTPGFPGEIRWDSDPFGASLHLTGTGVETTTEDTSIRVNPLTEGIIRGVVTLEGFNIYPLQIPVQIGTGTLSGTLRDASSNHPLPNQEVTLSSLQYDNLPPCEVVSNNRGEFTYHEAFPVGRYSLSISRYGYIALVDTFTLATGENAIQPELVPLEKAILTGTVTDASDLQPLDSVQVHILGQNLCDTTDQNGHYTIDSIIPDSLPVKISRRGYTPIMRMVTFTPGETVHSGTDTLFTGPQEYHYFFEWGNEGFQLWGDWELGIPGRGLYYRGPDSAFSGTRAVATVLDGDYSPSSNSNLETPPVYLDGYTHATLEFYHYFQMDHINSGFDGGNVKVSTDGGNLWTIIHPVDGYTVSELNPANIYMGGEPAFSGSQPYWKKIQFVLDDFIGTGELVIRFQFSSTPTVQDVGWYIDDLCIRNAVPDHIRETSTSIPGEFTIHANFPNPFNSGTTIPYEVPNSSLVTLKIFDLQGRDIATLVNRHHEPGKYVTRWPGMNSTHETCSSGIYFVVMITSETRFSRKIILLR